MFDTLFLIEIVTVLFLGLCLGSFSSALIWRVPQKIDWISKRSSCPNCHHDLSVIDLIPIFSLLLSKGACRYCGVRVSSGYAFLEIAAALLSCIAYLVFGFTFDLLFFLAALPFLLALFVIDMRKMILPNILVFICGAVGIIRLSYMVYENTAGAEVSKDILSEHILGAFLFMLLPLVLSFIMTRLLKRKAMGMGDIKFFFVAGLWLGLQDMPVYFIMSGAIACAHAILWQYALKRRVFPFGPALILSFCILLMAGGSFSY